MIPHEWEGGGGAKLKARACSLDEIYGRLYGRALEHDRRLLRI